MGIARFTAKTRNTMTLAVMAALASLATVASDASGVVLMDMSNGASQHWGTTTGGVSFFWNDDLPAHAGDDYEVDAGFVVRTPTSGSNAFPGDSLTLDGGQFNLSSTTGTTTTVTNLVLKSLGVVVNGSVNSTQTLAGTLSVATGETGFVRTGGTAGSARHINVSAAVSGGGTLHTLQFGNVTLSNATNTFGGIWRSGGTNVALGTGGTISNASNVVSTLTGTVAGSLGVNASVVLDAFSIFDPDFDWTTTGSLTINTDAALTLDDAAQVLTVGALTIGGVAVDPGVYTYTQLNDSYGAFIADGGQSSASVIVGAAPVPEPVTVGVLAVGGALAAMRRRRMS